MARLVNSCDYNGFTPLSMLSAPLPNGGGPDEEKLRQKMSKLLLEYSVGQTLSADDFGDLSYLLSDQVPVDGMQFAALGKRILDSLVRYHCLQSFILPFRCVFILSSVLDMGYYGGPIYVLPTCGSTTTFVSRMLFHLSVLYG